MTGYRDEDFVYKGYDMEILQEEHDWSCLIYLNGIKQETYTRQRKQEAIAIAKLWVDKHKESTK